MQTPKQPLHFRAINGAQALALAIAGFPCLGIKNEYTPAQLARLGCTAREAWEQRGIPGTVSYTFEKTEELLACASAFEEEVAKIKAGDGTEVEAERIEIVRIAAAVLVQRKPWADQWKRTPPFLRVEHAGEVTTRELPDGSLRTTFPGFTSIRIDASKEDLALLEKHLR